MADASKSWIDVEPGLAAGWSELSRMRRRAMKRPILTLGITLLVTGWAARKAARPKTSFTSKVIVRVTEGDIDPGTAQRPVASLRGYVGDVVISSDRLLEIARQRKLYSHDLARDPVLAVQSFREALGIEVWRNDFLWARDAGDAARSARISIAYSAADPQLAWDVAQQLGQLVVDSEEKAGVEAAETAADEAASTRDQLVAEIERRRAAIAREEELLGDEASPEAVIQLTTRRALLKGFEDQLSARTRRKEALELRTEIERHQLGVHFDIVDRGKLDQPTLSPRRQAMMVTLVTFPILLLLMAVAVGAFDTRIYVLDDVRRLGFSPLGHVGPFSGDRLGALGSGQRPGRRVQ